MYKKLLILDIDETLIHASEKMLDRQCDFEVHPYYIYKRPYLNEFLGFCFRNFEVAIWTSSSQDYAHDVIRHIFATNQQPCFFGLEQGAHTDAILTLMNLNGLKT